jgi:filamentous hemagglutinin
MNKQCYRIIFNKTRGLLMAVAESTNNDGKSTGTTEGSSYASSKCNSSSILATVRQITFALWSMMGLVMLPAALQAQVVANPKAPANQQPTVLTAPNGVPLVNIQTPSAAGVSRNTYNQFDVQQQGIILNNSRNNMQTQLGGWVQGNPWLATGTARIILNEVNSSNPSMLNGYIEVAGSKAQVVIANPAGITCSGCGFINASRTTITTGTPIMNNGSLEGYNIQGGTITITGNGMDASRVDYTDLIARAVNVNAGIWANQIKITIGANQVDVENTTATPIPGTGNAPVLGVDVSQLGGMYAGKITLVGTEAGVGVRNAGYIGASAGEVVVTADGRIENSGRITASSHVSVDSRNDIQNSGSIYAQGNAGLTAGGNIDNSGVIASQNNVALSVTGANSQINSTAASVLVSGIQPDNSIGTSGNLSVNATKTVTAQGQNLSGGDQTITAQAVDLSGSQTSANNLQVTATNGDVNMSGASIAASQNLTASTTQALRTDQATVSAAQINVTANSLSNVKGSIVQVGSGDLSLTLPGGLDNTQGRIATNSSNISITAPTITNAGGSLEHAGTGSFAVNVTLLDSSNGLIVSNGALDVKATSAVNLDGGTALANRIAIEAPNVSNRGGTIAQTGDGITSIKASGQFDNTGGLVVTNGSATLNAGNLANNGGTIQTVGSANVNVGSLDNTQGQITATQGLTVNATNGVNNTQGLLAANQALSVSGNQIDNTQGTIGSVQGQATVAANIGAINNTGGRIEAAQSVAVSAIGVNNTDGIVSGSSVAVDSQMQAIDNTRGKIVANGASDSGTMTIQSGAIKNEAGLIQSSGNMSVDTHGQVLANTKSGTSGGIVSQSGIALTAGSVDNRTGYIAASGAIDVQASTVTNAQGVMASGGTIGITGNALDNQGGQIQSMGDAIVKVTGSVDNTGGLLRSGQAVNVNADSIVNANTQGSNRGIEGQSINLNATQINNQSGSMLANDALTITSNGVINNTQGSISAGKTAILQDADPANKKLVITNTGGTIIAGQQLSIDAAGLSGDGKLLSQGDLGIKLTQNFTNTGQVIANGNAALETAGTLTNQASLMAGNALNVKAATIDNQAAGQIVAGQLKLEATDSHTFTNRGLIDSQNTVIESETVNNLGTGRIYGDNIAINATTLNNDAESGAAPVIAARNRVDIGAQTINNREGALIFSAGDMAIGGSLDTNRLATGQATTLNNVSANIEATGNLDISAKQINNINAHFSTKLETTGAVPVVEYAISGAANHYTEGTTGLYTYNSYDNVTGLHTPDGATSDGWNKYEFTRTTTETKIQTSAPGQIMSGGSMTINADTVNNDKSRIIAGGTLLGTIGTLNNTEVSGQKTITDSGTVTSAYIVYQKASTEGPDYTAYSPTAYTPAASVQTISLTPSTVQQNTAPTGTGTQVSALTPVEMKQAVTGGPKPIVNINKGFTVSPISEVKITDASGGASTVVRSGGVNTTIPTNSLFHVNPNPSGNYLIETDPAFASYRNWLSSDYLLNALSLDPATTEKRLGDGFYEQKLIREQVAMLTGRRFLDGYADDEAQYQALMANAATFAKAQNLRPGVALSSAQMAALTSDIVWLVEKEVTLASGKTEKVLVPQLYVRVKEGDLQANGALIAGNNVGLNITGDLTNSGTIAGRNVVMLTAENVNNLGGRITGNDVGIVAKNDLNNIAGQISASNSLQAIAGRDINVTSTTRTQTSAQGSMTNIDRVAGLYVTGGDGILVASAGHDVNLLAAAIVNIAPPPAAGPSSEGPAKGSTTIVAGNNLNLGTVTTASSNSVAWDGKNYRKESSSTDNGTVIQTQGDITLQAGNDLNAKAANVTSNQGALLATAGNNVNLTAGEANVTVDEAHQHKSSGFLSTKTITTRDTLDQTAAQGTTLSGNTAVVIANNDITLKGSNVVSTQGTVLSAQNNINIEAATDTTQEGHFRDEKKSGLMGSGGFGFTIGTRQQSTDSQNTSTSASASTVGSTEGNVVIQAGKTYTQVGSNVLAPQGNIDIAAQKVDILEAQNTSQTSTETKFKQSGLTVAVSSPVITAIQTAQAMSKAASQTKDTRMQVLAGATTALSVYNAYNAVQAGQGTTFDGKEGQIITRDAQGNITGSRDANAADQVGGINVSISIGSSKSQSNTVQTSSTASGSTVAAGGNVNISATGAGKDSDLTIQGSHISAGNNVTLKADDEINLLAAKNTAEQHSTNKSSSGSIGVSFGTGGFGVTVAASAGRGNADGNDVTWTNTHVDAGNKLTIESGGDTNIKGAVATGKQVVADVGGNLNIESLQDTSTYKSKQQNIGGSITVGAGVSGSLSYSNSKVNSTYASVTEQSGIKAGDEGFQVNVKGNTDLKGAVIASTDKAVQDGKNSFTTASLTTSDIQNKADYKGSSFGINLGAGYSASGALTPGGTSAGLGKESGSASSTTQSGISGIAGNKDIRTGDKETGIGTIFDATKVQQSIDAQVKITQMFGQLAPKAVGDYAGSKAAELRRQGNEEEARKWDEGGVYRVAMHTAIGGLTGDLKGALGAGVSAYTVPMIAEQIKQMDIPAELKTSLIAVAGTAVGAAVGGASGAVAGMNQTVNNYLTHTEIIQLQKAREAGDQDKVDALTKLSGDRNAALNNCGDNCAALNQDARIAAAEIARILGNSQIPLSDNYLHQASETLYQATKSLPGGDLAKGLAVGGGIGVVNSVKGLAQYISDATLVSEGDPDAYNKFQAGGEALSNMLKDKQAFEAGLRNLSQAELNTLAIAIEQGDGYTAGKFYGKILGEIAAGIILPGAVQKGVSKTLDVAKNIESLAVKVGKLEAGVGIAATDAGLVVPGKVTGQFNMVTNPGPLANMPGIPAANFAGGNYSAIALTEDVILYRGGSSTGSPLGQWFTAESPTSVAQVRIDTAVKPQWINPTTGALVGTSPIDAVYAVKVPAGTTVYQGPVASQGGIYVGGSGAQQTQIFIPKTTSGLTPVGVTPLR